MLRKIIAIGALCLLLFGCTPAAEPARVAATTLPVYEFTLRLCQGTDLTVCRLVTDSVSCLHDYTLNVGQVRAARGAELIVLSGGGLEDFMSDILADKPVIDSSAGIPLLECAEEHDHDHHHEEDNHFWLSPGNAAMMATNICQGLSRQYSEYSTIFAENLQSLLADILAVENYANTQLKDLSCRELITFHDGFSHLADAFDLTVLKAMEEESGSEASASELKELITLVRSHNLPAVFTERNGSTAAAGVISAETGVRVFALDMAISGDSWFTAMYHNIDTLKEALE